MAHRKYRGQRNMVNGATRMQLVMMSSIWKLYRTDEWVSITNHLQRGKKRTGRGAYRLRDVITKQYMNLLWILIQTNEM